MSKRALVVEDDGNIAELLMNIRAISSDVLKDGMCCLPYIAFDGVTISGK